MTEQNTIAGVCNAIQEQVREGELFWRANPPRDYSTGCLFGGFNAAILGADPMNKLDPRWITEGERITAGFTTRTGAKPCPVLIFTHGEPNLRTGVIDLADNNDSDPGRFTHVMTEKVWNAVSIDSNLPNPYERVTSEDLSVLLPLERIPYKTENGIKYFDVKEKFESGRLLGFEPLEMLRSLTTSLLPKIRTSTNDPTPGTADSVYDKITIELASCRLANILGIKIDNTDANALDIRQAITNLDLSKESERMKFVRCFTDATELERALLNDSSEDLIEEEAGPGYQAVEPFLGATEWNQILSAKTHSAGWILIVEALKSNCQMCKEAADQETAYLRYIPDITDDLAEFYATNLTEDGRINGIFKISGGAFDLSLTPDELHGNFSADVTWIPAPVSALK